jgi:hypothetical protein
MPRYTLEELARLVGKSSAKALGTSLRRLERTGLSTWNTSEISFSDLSDLTPAAGEEFTTRLARITNHRRRVPVPRRTIRWLAKASRPVLVATVFGHLFRCVYAKGRYLAAEGSISATWVSEVFDVDPRNVKRAKVHLRRISWLSPKASDHWHKQRYGGTVAVNLMWMEGKGGTESSSFMVSQLPPRNHITDGCLPPPDSNRKLLTESKNQKPAAPGPSGVHKPNPQPITLRNIQAEDLRDAGRLLMLHRQAQERGFVGRSEHDRLQFMSAAVRASAKATRNPGGFFWRLIQQRLWHHITAADESKAHIMLKKHLFPTGGNDRPQRAPPPDPGHRSQMDDDIRLVAHLIQSFQSHGISGDAFVHLAQHDPNWTRERWNLAYRGWLIPERTVASAEPLQNQRPS